MFFCDFNALSSTTILLKSSALFALSASMWNGFALIIESDLFLFFFDKVLDRISETDDDFCLNTTSLFLDSFSSWTVYFM